MALVIPNDLVNSTVADATKVQANFDAIETWAAVEDGANAAAAAAQADADTNAAAITSGDAAVTAAYIAADAVVTAAAAADATTKADAAETDAKAYADTLHAAVSWTNVTFQNSWVDYAGGFQAVSYRKVDDVVQMRGMCKSGTATAGTVICNLPAGYRPSATAVFLVANDAGSARIDVEADGDVVLYGTTGHAPTNTYLSLDQVMFSVTA